MKSTKLGSMNYTEYFDEFEDINQLKQAAKVWVKEDIRRLKKLEKQIDSLLEEREEKNDYKK